MKKNILIHIPHSSLKLSKKFLERTLLDKENLDKVNVFLSDYLVDMFLPKKAKILKFKMSRLFCDVERFKDDEKETMSKYGMGVMYQKDHKGRDVIKVDEKYKNYVLERFYQPHHAKLDKLSSKILKKYKGLYLIDLHSYSDEFVNEVFGLEDNPDICIGYDEGFCDEALIDAAKMHFESFGYSVKVNYPYSGSIIPNKFFKDNKVKISSLMIEINKRIYLDENTKLNEEKYQKLKTCMDEFYKLIDSLVK